MKKLLNKTVIILISFLGLSLASFAQKDSESAESTVVKELEKSVKTLEKFKVSGYVQTQFQYGEKDASLKVGAANEDSDASFNRIGIRRGRVKFTYAEKIASAVFQLDLTEKGIGFKDVYLDIKDPWLKTISLRAGIFDRPFGYEISYSSSRRESPERSTVFQTLFPEERDLGTMLVLQTPKGSKLNFLKLEAGLFAGNGIKQETDNKKDFIGHLSAENKFGDNFLIGGGISYYNGNVYQGSDRVYKMSGTSFILEDTLNSLGKFAKREYFGIDARFSIKSKLGITQLRGECLFGQQPGSARNSKSPNSSTLPTHDTYIRNFSGFYIMFIQSIGKLPVSLIAKYDALDANTKVSGEQVGLYNTTSADLSQTTLGLGVLWDATKNIRMQAYYELNSNEKSQNISGYEKDGKNDVFTLRLQYKF
jgi:phosphate-selective porin